MSLCTQCSKQLEHFNAAYNAKFLQIFEFRFIFERKVENAKPKIPSNRN